MGSRKIDLPPNFEYLDDEMKVKVTEEIYRWQLKLRHGKHLGDPLLKSGDKIQDLEL